MKTISIIIGAAFLIVSFVLISLVRKGGALKPAGVIKPTVIGTDPALIGSQVAARLFPDFHEAKFVIWRLENGAEIVADVPRIAHEHYQSAVKPALVDLRNGVPENCAENCWYVLGIDSALPDSVARKTAAGATAEVFIQTFDRDEKVPEVCESEKILKLGCMRPVSVREVRRKIKTPAPHFFMQRYLKSQFYLFVEQKSR